MKRIVPAFLLLTGMVAAGTSSLRAEESAPPASSAATASGPFSQAVSPSDAAAAGLDKLTPAERAKLDELVEKYRSGALEAAAAAEKRAEAAEAAAEEARRAAATAQARAEQEHARVAQAQAQAERAKAQAEQEQSRAAQARAEAAEAHAAAEKAKAEAKKASSTSFLSKAKAVILPGTRIEYAPIDAHIVGRIKGWHAKQIFVLDNGQSWQVADDSSYFEPKAVTNPHVTIRPARLFGFEMHIDGMGYFRVKLLGGPIYKETKD